MSQKALNNFVDTHPVFKAGVLSPSLRKSLANTLLGLGLPLPTVQKRSVWGYEKHGDIYFPIESDLDILYKALDMLDSWDYHQDDVVAWFKSATPNPLSRRMLLYIRTDRPLFPEYKTLSVEQRIDLFTNVIRPTTATD